MSREQATDMRESAGGADGRMKPVAQGAALAFNDVDGDGVVTWTEFIGRVADRRALLNRDGDGAVSVSGFVSS